MESIRFLERMPNLLHVALILRKDVDSGPLRFLKSLQSVYISCGFEDLQFGADPPSPAVIPAPTNLLLALIQLQTLKVHPAERLRSKL